MPRIATAPLLVPAIGLLLATGCSDTARDRRDQLDLAHVPDRPYLGQTPPGSVPQPFAPGLVCTGMTERDIAMTPDGGTIFFGRSVGRHSVTTILVTRRTEHGWTEPAVASFARDPRFHHLEPHVAPDGERLYFVSDRPDTAGGKLAAGDQDIWTAERSGDGWGVPYRLDPPVNTAAPEFFPSVTRDGALYFCRQDPGARSEAIYRAAPRADGGFAAPERLPDAVNAATAVFNAFVAPDESFVIACMPGREDALGAVDYYVSFRSADCTWRGPFNLGEPFNGPDAGRGWSPYVSPDDRYFFFMTSRFEPADRAELGDLTAGTLAALHDRWGNGLPDIYWVEARFIEELRPE